MQSEKFISNRAYLKPRFPFVCSSRQVFIVDKSALKKKQFFLLFLPRFWTFTVKQLFFLIIIIHFEKQLVNRPLRC